MTQCSESEIWIKYAADSEGLVFWDTKGILVFMIFFFYETQMNLVDSKKFGLDFNGTLIGQYGCIPYVKLDESCSPLY